jgi:hypothetical protein
MANFSSIAGPFSGALGGKSFPASYPFAKRFVQNATSAQGSGNNGVTALDDPTYLGFGLMFDITSPLFNAAWIGDTPVATDSKPPPEPTLSKLDGLVDSATKKLGGLKDKVGNALGIDNFGGPPTPEDGGAAPATFPAEASAVGYLHKIGEVQRMKYMKAFIQGLLEVTNTRPYYFQTITGLLEAWSKSTEFTEDPYTGADFKAGVTIGCLEAIDLKMTGLFNLYRMAVYDEKYKRFILPKNLMRFDVYVDVHEIRRFKTVRNWLKALNPSDTTKGTKDFVNENSSRIRFKFTECMFDPAASGKVFDTVKNNGGEVASTEIKFGYGSLELMSQYSGFDDSLDVSKQQISSNPSFTDKIKQFGKAQLDNAVQGVANKLTSAVNSAIQGITLGNVFGLRNELLGTLANPQGLLNAALGAAGQSGSLDTFGQPNINNNLGDNPMGDAAAPLQTINSSRAYDPSTDTHGGLKTINAFGAPGPAQDNGGLASSNIFE